MRPLDTIALALRMFQTRRTRTLLTILGVAIGIATVHLLVSFGYGLQETVLRRIASTDALLSLDVTIARDSENGNLTLQTIAAIDGIDDVSRLRHVQGHVRTDSVSAETALLFIDSSYPRYAGMSLEQGRFFSDGTSEAVLSSAGVRLLGLSKEEILEKAIIVQSAAVKDVESGSGARTSRLWSGTYVIVGILKQDNQSQLYLPFSALPKATSDFPDRLKVGSRQSLPAVREKLTELGHTVASISDVIEEADKIFRIIQIVLAVFGIVALFVSSIGMFNTMTVTLLERTQEIGIMRAIGMSRGGIRMMFLIESMLMGFLGGFLGIAISLITSSALNAALNGVAVRFGGESLDLFSSPWWFTALIILCSTFIGLCTGIFPSRRAAKLNPLDALRYK
jgi:putative ABC transport system permease protein